VRQTVKGKAGATSQVSRNGASTVAGKNYVRPEEEEARNINSINAILRVGITARGRRGEGKKDSPQRRNVHITEGSNVSRT